MPKNRCYHSRDNDSSDESSDECECKRCEKEKQKSRCKKHECCCKKKEVYCKKTRKESICNKSYINEIDYCKKECQDGKVILISIS